MAEMPGVTRGLPAAQQIDLPKPAAAAGNKVSLAGGPERPVQTQPAAQKSVFERIGAAVSEAMSAVSVFFKGLSNRTAIVQTPNDSPVVKDLSAKEYAMAQRELPKLQALQSSLDRMATPLNATPLNTVSREYMERGAESDFGTALREVATAKLWANELDFMDTLNSGDMLDAAWAEAVDANIPNQSQLRRALDTLAATGIPGVTTSVDYSEKEVRGKMSLTVVVNAAPSQGTVATGEQQSALDNVVKELERSYRAVESSVSLDSGKRAVNTLAADVAAAMPKLAAAMTKFESEHLEAVTRRDDAAAIDDALRAFLQDDMGIKP